jgi:hypothetical protein
MAQNNSALPIGEDGWTQIILDKSDSALQNVAGVQTQADGGNTIYGEDAAGNLINQSCDANGFQTSDLWKNIDGAHGFDLFNADSSSSGRFYMGQSPRLASRFRLRPIEMRDQ